MGESERAAGAPPRYRPKRLSQRVSERSPSASTSGILTQTCEKVSRGAGGVTTGRPSTAVLTNFEYEYETLFAVYLPRPAIERIEHRAPAIEHRQLSPGHMPASSTRQSSGPACNNAFSILCFWLS
jgi:hypothetical protein